MENGPRQKPPPPPPEAMRRAAPSNTPSSEGIMVRSSGVSEKLMERMRSLLPVSVRATLSVDIAGNVMANGSRIGVHEKDRFLIDMGPLFATVPVSATMRSMAQAKRMVIFIEVTANEACVCAGSAFGQKLIYSRLS